MLSIFLREKSEHADGVKSVETAAAAVDCTQLQLDCTPNHDEFMSAARLIDTKLTMSCSIDSMITIDQLCTEADELIEFNLLRCS